MPCYTARMSDKKLDHIIAPLADMLTMFGKRFDAIDDTLDEHSRILKEHSQMLDQHGKLHGQHGRDLSSIKSQLAHDLDKRKQLEVRVANIEKRIAA
jgi:hypothetical protein